MFYGDNVDMVFYVILQCSWGCFQTLAGFVCFLRYASCPHTWFHGAIHTQWNREDGISLGLFIFTPEKEDASDRRMTVHEYGHTIQSLMLGPLYLFVIGIPSLFWANLNCCRRMRRERQTAYSWFYTEAWANWLGRRLTGMEALNW